MDKPKPGRSSQSPTAAETAEWSKPDHWQQIVQEGDGDVLAEEAQAFLQQLEGNVPQDMRPGFEALEHVLLDVCRNAPTDVIKRSERAIGAVAGS